MSMTPLEHAIVDLRDQGLSLSQIERRGYKMTTIKHVLGYLGSDSSDKAQAKISRVKMARGSRNLALAVIDLLDEIHKASVA